MHLLVRCKIRDLLIIKTCHQDAVKKKKENSKTSDNSKLHHKSEARVVALKKQIIVTRSQDSQH